MKIRFLKHLVMQVLGVRRITEDRLRAIGFTDSADDRGLDVLVKHGIEVWNFTNPAIGDYWLVDLLDQAAIDREFYYMHELELFFTACGLDMKAA